MTAEVTAEDITRALALGKSTAAAKARKQRAEAAMLAKWHLELIALESLSDEELIERGYVCGNAIAALLGARFGALLDSLPGR